MHVGARLILLAIFCLPDCSSSASLRWTARSYRQTLHNYGNVQYSGDFTIGGQHIRGLIDTGSWNLILRSTRCDDCAHPTPPYNHSASSTYKIMGIVTDHYFASGNCQTLMGTDVASVGPLSTHEQVIYEITSHGLRILDTARYAAIVGMGLLPHDDEKTLLMSFGLDEFSVCFQKASGSDGFLTWGSAAQSGMTPSDYATAAVVGKHHWTVRLHNVTLQGPDGLASVNLCTGAGCAVAIDSGASLIAGPPAALMELSDHIDVKSDCSNLHELPVLRFVVGGQPLELPPEAYVIRVMGTQEEVDAAYSALPIRHAARKPNTCVAAFTPMSSEETEFGPLWLLGMPFFRYYHTTFDRTRAEVRFAQAGPGCEPRPLAAPGTAALIGGRGAVGLEGILEMAAVGIMPPNVGAVDV